MAHDEYRRRPCPDPACSIGPTSHGRRTGAPLERNGDSRHEEQACLQEGDRRVDELIPGFELDPASAQEGCARSQTNSCPAARPARFERATCGFEGRRQSQGTPRSYPLSDPNLILFNEATALLALASNGVPVARDRAERFVRAVLEATDVGRMALAVLDAGLFAGARLVELATHVVEARSSPTIARANGGGTEP